MSEFVSWRRAALLNDADRDGAGRLIRRLTVTLTDSAASPPASDDVSVRSRDGRRGQTLEVRVHPDDLGRVIGRSGRTAKALRTVVSALASGENVRVDVVDTDRRR